MIVLPAADRRIQRPLRFRMWSQNGTVTRKSWSRYARSRRNLCLYFTRCGLMSLFRGSCLGTHCSRGSCLAGLSQEAGASSAVRSRAGALERELTASFQAACSTIRIRQSSWVARFH